MNVFPPIFVPSRLSFIVYYYSM